MGRGEKLGSICSKKNRVVSTKKGSDGSDEDYVFDEDEDANESEGSYVALAELASEEEFNFEGEDEEEDKKVVKRVKKDSKPQMGVLDKKETRVRTPVKRARVSEDEEEDYDFDEKEDEDEDEDEDDDEFSPDEIDSVDEEEEFEVKTKSNNVRKQVSRKKVSSKQGKRKRKPKVVKKPSRKKPRKVVVRRPLSSDDDFDDNGWVAPKRIKKKSTGSKKRKAVSSDDDFDDDYGVAPKRIRKKSTRSNKRLVIDWDSDYVSSGPSDHEYTISDEEKLLLTEANRFLGNMEARNSSLSKRLEIEKASNFQQPKPVVRKGKEKVKELTIDSAKQVCGICFSEEKKNSVRGTLDCCSHYFCFACIMEWSKVESRCPLCKQRFATLSKPARSNLGFELRNTVIQVPKRDQVYQPSEEELRGYLNPYEDVICIECQRGGDDSLMLLCDLCDSAAHTYCVGLGHEVPDGNWYCKGCHPGSSQSQVQDSISTDLPVRMSNVEDSDPTIHLSLSVPDSPFPSGFGVPPSPRYPVGEDGHVVSPSGIGASTLSERLRIRHRIRDMLSHSRMSPIAESSGRNNVFSVKNEVADDIEQSEEAPLRPGSHPGDFWDLHPSQERDPISRLINLGRSSIPTSDSSVSGTIRAEVERTNLTLGFSNGYINSEAAEDEFEASENTTFRHGSHPTSGNPWVPDFSSYATREEPVFGRINNLGRSNITSGSICGEHERTNSRLGSSERFHRCSSNRSFNLSEDSKSPRQMEGASISMDPIHSNKWTSR